MDLSISLGHFSVPTHQSKSYQVMAHLGRLAGQESPHRFQERMLVFQPSLLGSHNQSIPPGRKIQGPAACQREQQLSCPSQSTGSIAPLETFHRKAERAPISSGKQQAALCADAAVCDSAWVVKTAVSSTDERHPKKHGRRSTAMRVQYFHFPSVSACPAVTRRRSEKITLLKFYFMFYLIFTVLHKGPV